MQFWLKNDVVLYGFTKAIFNAGKMAFDRHISDSILIRIKSFPPYF